MHIDTARPRDLAREMTTHAHLRTLHDKLAADADTRGLLDVAYRTIDTPVGQLLLAATQVGLVRVAYATEGYDSVLQTLSERISPRVLRAPARLDRAAREVEDYFAGKRTTFDLQLDWRLSSGFRNTVPHHLASDVPFGQTASYRTLATLAGNAAAVRAVGTACSTNPLPVVVPCHRIVRSDGSLAAYLGGSAASSGTKFVLLGADGSPYWSATPGQLGGYRHGKLYGRLDCPSALRAIAAGGYVKNRVFFADEATAIAAGYRPCAVCLPVEYRLWKNR